MAEVFKLGITANNNQPIKDFFLIHMDITDISAGVIPLILDA